MGDGVALTGEVFEQNAISHGEIEDLKVDILDNFNSYMDDIDDRLTISRMVSNSVIKGIVKAVDKMAEEKIAEKDSEVVRMREKIHLLEFGGENRDQISNVLNVKDGLDSLLALNLEEISRFQKIGDEISERMNELSNVRNELHLLYKSLPGSESGKLVSQGSSDMDNFYRKLLRSHDSSLLENVHSEESKTGLPGTCNVAPLTHLNTEGLVGYFNSIITNLKRDHESRVQKITEDYFILKREYFKEKDYSLKHQKDKDLEVVRKKISEVILKLDNIVSEKEKLSAFRKNTDTFTSLKDRVNDLLLENHHLRDSLCNKKREIENLNLQVSDASENMLHHFLAEDKLKKLTGDTESVAEDEDIKNFLIQEVYLCVMRGLTLNVNEELEMLCNEVAQDVKGAIEDSDLEPSLSQGLSEILYKEAITDAKEIINDMSINYIRECESRNFFEKKLSENEKELKSLVEENERLKEEVDLLVTKIEGQKKLNLELSDTLMKERDQLELVSHELNNQKSSVGWLESSLNKRDEELDLIKSKLSVALENVESGKLDINKMKQKIVVISDQLKVAIEERDAINTTAQKNQNFLDMLEANKDEQRRQMQSVVDHIHGLSREFSEYEGKVSEDIKQKILRLEEFKLCLQSLFKKADIHKKTVSVYKQKLERKSADLETAETEVDLLGDQVDTLVNLLEKIYIALDHYSPILQHYPGVMEILKLVKRELSGESVKPN